MSDIKGEIQKIIDGLESRRTGCIFIGDGSDYYQGKADGYHQAISLLESMLDSLLAKEKENMNDNEHTEEEV